MNNNMGKNPFIAIVEKEIDMITEQSKPILTQSHQ